MVTSGAAPALAELIRTVSALPSTGTRPQLIRSAVDEVEDLVAGIVAGGSAEGPGCTLSAAAKVVRKCEALASSFGPIPRVAALARALDVSDRWIRSAFAEFYGVSPSTYFRARAINGARRDLLRAPPRSTTTSEVAMRWGFWHLGRFAQLFRAYFDELPSTTLARPVDRTARPDHGDVAAA